MLVEINWRRLIGGEGHQPGQVGRRRHHVHSALRHREQAALGQEPAGPFDFRAVDRQQLAGWGRLGLELLDYLSPGTPVELPSQGRELLRRLLLEALSVAPQLSGARHQCVLVLEPPAELLLTNGKGLRVRGGLDPVAQGGAELDQRLERLFSRLPELIREFTSRAAKAGNDLGNELSSAGEHGERGIYEDRRRFIDGGLGCLQKRRGISQPSQHRRRANRRLRLVRGSTASTSPETGGKARIPDSGHGAAPRQSDSR